MSLETLFRTDLAGVDTDVLVLREAVRVWSRTRPFQPPLSPLQIRSLGERAAASALAAVGAVAGDRWRVIVSASVTTRRLDLDAGGGAR